MSSIAWSSRLRAYRTSRPRLGVIAQSAPATISCWDIGLMLGSMPGSTVLGGTAAGQFLFWMNLPTVTPADGSWVGPQAWPPGADGVLVVKSMKSMAYVQSCQYPLPTDPRGSENVMMSR